MNAPIVKAEMLIRKPPADVFNAFVDPAITTEFWFTKASGKLEPGKRVRWDWEMYTAEQCGSQMQSGLSAASSQCKSTLR